MGGGGKARGGKPAISGGAWSAHTFKDPKMPEQRLPSKDPAADVGKLQGRQMATRDHVHHHIHHPPHPHDPPRVTRGIKAPPMRPETVIKGEAEPEGGRQSASPYGGRQSASPSSLREAWGSSLGMDGSEMWKARVPWTERFYAEFEDGQAAA